eukprot:g25702.t1
MERLKHQSYGGTYGGQQVWPQRQPQQATVQSENILQRFLAAHQQQHLPSPLATHQPRPLPGTHQPHPSPGTQQLAGSAPAAHVDASVAARIQSGIRTINASGSVAISAIY